MRAALVAVVAVIALGCGGSASSLPVVPSASATSAPTDTPAPATPTLKPSTTPASTQSAVFASMVYPYTLELPSGVLTRNWKLAAFPWDGEAPIDTASRSIDITGTVSGALYVFGLPWPADLAGFADLVRTNAERFNGCRGAEDPREVEVDGVPGIAQRQSCENQTQALYLVIVRDGLGLGFRMRDYRDPETVIDELVTWLGDGLTWPTP